MCDCTPSSISPYSHTKFPLSSIHTTLFLSSFQFPTKKPQTFSIKISQNSNPPNSHQFFNELKLQDSKPTDTQFNLDQRVNKDSNFIEFDEKLREKLSENEQDREDDLVKIEEKSKDDVIVELGDKVKVVRKGKELMKRGNVIAKQVISIQSALSLGFISQLWVDTNTWMVVIVEVRPNLLSEEQERFFLDDITQVGDVVLIEDETVMDNEFKLVELETLVGYSVVTPGRRDIGKVRGYTFNINSGAIESLELDSFGISIIPSSLVSTYALLVEDILEVVSDTVVVHEAAASRIQRLTKGFWGAQRMSYSMDNLDDFSDLVERSEYQKGRRKKFGASRQKPGKQPLDDPEEDWNLPMDYL